MRKIALNTGYCNKCHETIISHHRHDFVTCRCGASSLDGGTEYVRYIGSCSPTTVYTDDDFEIVRVSAERGTFDEEGRKIWKKICDLTDDHLEAILDYGGPAWHLELIRKEINYRKNNMV